MFKHGFPPEWSTLKKLLLLRLATSIKEVWKTISNAAIATFTAVASPLRQLVVAIEPVQDLNGYDNPWPAGGGKNKLSYETISLEKPDTRTKSVNITPIPAGSYIFSWNFSGSATSCSLAFRTGNGVSEGQVSVNLVSGGSQSVTFTEEMKNVYAYIGSTQADGVTADITQMMVRLSTEADATFAPYSNICPISGWSEAKVWVKSTHDTSSSPTVTIDLNGTRYGGTLDVLTGVLTVDREEVDLGTLDYTLMGNTSKRQAWQHQFNDIKKLTTGNTDLPAISSQFKAASLNATWLPGIMAPPGLNSTWVCFCVNSGQYANADEFKAAMSGVQFVYELETPQTVQLTAQQVSSLAGTNVLFADAGNVTVEYREL